MENWRKFLKEVDEEPADVSTIRDAATDVLRDPEVGGAINSEDLEDEIAEELPDELEIPEDFDPEEFATAYKDNIAYHESGDILDIDPEQITDQTITEADLRAGIEIFLEAKEEILLEKKRRKSKSKKRKKKKKGKKDACYHKVRARYDVWPSAYASGALVRCRKVGAANWGNKSKKKKK